MTVVCEGVETAEQHHRLTTLRSDCCQGFYFAKPMLASRLSAFIQHQEEDRDVPFPATERGFAA
jgi:EAL domain-containing protein (putative c-di-GMP-specific phosphodiesterase class I)